MVRYGRQLEKEKGKDVQIDKFHKKEKSIGGESVCVVVDHRGGSDAGGRNGGEEKDPLMKRQEHELVHCFDLPIDRLAWMKRLDCDWQVD